MNELCNHTIQGELVKALVGAQRISQRYHCESNLFMGGYDNPVEFTDAMPDNVFSCLGQPACMALMHSQAAPTVQLQGRLQHCMQTHACQPMTAPTFDTPTAATANAASPSQKPILIHIYKVMEQRLASDKSVTTHQLMEPIAATVVEMSKDSVPAACAWQCC